MAEIGFSVAVFPFLKTSEPVHLGSFRFRSTDDTDGLPADQSIAVAEIAAMLFVRDDYRVAKSVYAILPSAEVTRDAATMHALERVRDTIAYFYSSPHPTLGNLLLTPSSAALHLLAPKPVISLLVRPEYGTISTAPEPPAEPDDRHELPGYEGRFDLREPLWVTAGSRIYAATPNVGLNMSQDLAADFGTDRVQMRDRRLRSLYCCSDGVRGRGAPVTNLAHNASFHSNERIAPSNRGIKHRAPP